MYHSEFDVMLHYVENLLAHLSEVEHHVGHRQQYSIDKLAERVKELMVRIERLKSRVAKQEMLNYRLTRRVEELQAELARRDWEGRELAPASVRRDSHYSVPSVALNRGLQYWDTG